MGIINNHDADFMPPTKGDASFDILIACNPTIGVHTINSASNVLIRLVQMNSMFHEAMSSL